MPCGTIQLGLCVGRLSCGGMAGGMMRTCQRPPALMAPCDGTSATAPNCNIFQSMACSNAMGAGTCQMVNWVGAGQSCADPNRCSRSAYCANGQCQAMPTQMQMCVGTNNACAVGFYCGSNGLCDAEKMQSAACMGPNECASPLVCQNGNCQELQYTNCQ